jgi:hypothetical protein
MTLTIHSRSAIVTATTTYKGHYFEFHENGDGNTAAIVSHEDEVLRTLTAANYESRDGVVYRVTGLNPDGEPEIWRAVAQCARCATPAVYPTPAYDVPT